MSFVTQFPSYAVIGTEYRPTIVCNNFLSSVTYTINVFSLLFSDPPSPPRILGLDVNEVLLSGSLKRVTCTAIAGNPLANLKWFMGDKQLQSYYVTKDNYASAELELIPSPGDNLQQLRCEASNLALQQPLEETRNLVVKFAPTFVKVSMNPEKPSAGRNITLTCDTGPSNPRALVAWWHNGKKLESEKDVYVDGNYGGIVTTSQLTLAVTAEHDGTVVTCEASSEGIQKKVHDAITLSVNRKYYYFLMFSLY